jgi:hypothetical protein
MNAPPDLGGEFLEALGPERTRSMLRRGRHWRRNGQMESRVKCDGLIHDLEIAIEVVELTAHPGEPTGHCGSIADVVVRTEEAIERGLDKRRFCGPGTLGRDCHLHGQVFGKIDANPWFHV